MMWLALITALSIAADADDRPTVVVVVGAAGETEYAEQFDAWADRWTGATATANARLIRIGGSRENEGGTEPEAAAESATTDRDLLKQQIDRLRTSSTQAVWLVLIGHGTFDGRSARFNLNGPDVSAAELAQWIKPLQMPLAIINCASSSSPFINELSGQSRVIVTATKSGYEYNFARFGDYLSSSIADPAVDLDKDGQTSLLEAFLAASARVREFYTEQSRLATEHALLDDNGDALGTPADWFRGFRAIRTAIDGATPDGSRANQFFLNPSTEESQMPAEARQRRDQLELEIDHLRQQKPDLAEADYYGRLAPLMVELARLYSDLEQDRRAEEGK